MCVVVVSMDVAVVGVVVVVVYAFDICMLVVVTDRCGRCCCLC